MEPFVIASNRQLSALHPIYKLLHPHFRDTMPVNVVARQIALNAKGLFEAAVYPQQYVGPWTSALYKDWVFTEQALPRDLIKRYTIQYLTKLFVMYTFYKRKILMLDY